MAEAPDEWQPVGQQAPPPEPPDEWQPVGGQPKPEGGSGISSLIGGAALATMSPAFAPIAVAAAGKDIRDIFMEGAHTLASAPAQIMGGDSPSFAGLGDKIKENMIAAGHSPDDASKEAAKLTANLSRNEGLMGLVMGPMQMASAPVLGAIRAFVSRPIEDETGFPKEVTEGLINVGLSVLGMRAPKPGVPRIEPLVEPKAAEVPREPPGPELPEGAVQEGTAHRLPITGADGSEVGNIKFEVDSNDLIRGKKTIQVSGVQIDDAANRGKGYAVDAYQKLADFALSTGRELWSDRSVSPDAARIYEALERRGYTVVKEGADEPRYGALYKVTDGPQLDLQQASDLGVIGEERKPVSETVAAEQKRPETVTQEVGGGNPWRERFDQFVGKLKAPDDVKQLIREAADENGEFLPARQGDIPLKHVEDIAEAAGVAPEEINQRGLGRTLRNDAEVRTAMQLMTKAADNVKDAAREVKSDGSPESLIKLQEAIMRRDLAVEQIVGLRAEWGRTGNVFQEFLRDVKDQEGLSSFLKDKGRSPDDLRNIADAIDGLDPGQAARFLSDARTPTFWDKFMYYWVNALISGPVTHAKYIVANGVFAAYESAVVTPIAGAIGTAARAVTGGREGVYIGESAARLWGVVAGTPDALVAAAKAARTGLQTALPGEVAQNIIPTQQKNIAFQQKPIEGNLGLAIGIPSRGASAIHSFFNFLGYRASMEAQAYRSAAKEGLRPTDDAFWRHREDKVANPTTEMMNEGIEEGYRLTYISELSPTAKKLTSAIKATKIGQLILPFMHIPFNILARGLEGSPLAFLAKETRDNVMGRNGVVKQDMAVARLVAGSAIGAWAVNLVANDRMTGFGPTEPKERAQWLATGHQPYSIRIGDYWYSFNRFGSLGTMLGIHANLAEAIPHMQPDAEELTKALTMTVHATGKLLEDEVGMQGLAGLIEAINEPDRKGQRFVSNFAGSMLPYSSLLRQTASAMDPSMREAKTVTDGLRYYIPNVRQGLAPKRDWLGEPIANAGYGGDIPHAPGLSAIIQHRESSPDPINWEMKTLDLHPAPPQDRIGGAKLPPKMYDEYQGLAGPMTRHGLESMVNMPGWYEMPPFAREQVFRNTIRATRGAAAASMQLAHPELIQTGVDNKVGHINGQKPVKLKD